MHGTEIKLHTPEIKMNSGQAIVLYDHPNNKDFHHRYAADNKATVIPAEELLKFIKKDKWLRASSILSFARINRF
jgi:hypothetical protein